MNTSNTNKIDKVKSFLLKLQDEICQELEGVEDGASFIEDDWRREEGGGGRTRLLSAGSIFEQAGVNFSHVHGDTLPPSATQARPELAGCKFEALGVSLVIHPRNPHIPTSHANVRFFIAQSNSQDGEQKEIWWFGGGFDLTPYYPQHEDVLHWHHTAKKACDPFGDQHYSRYKKWCDEYFFLPHRNETRGVGGLFFDDYNEVDFDHSFSFMKSVGEHFCPAYMPIVNRRKNDAFGENERHFQLYRRGRYVEFNLVFDRGTLFGLQSGGRTESILMSMPPLARWEYNFTPKDGSSESILYKDYLRARDWLAEDSSK